MALVFKTPKTAINTTTRDIQNIKDGECPPCPECPEVELTTAEVEYTENGSFTVTPESGFDGLSQVDITVNIDTQAIEDAAYAEGESAGIVTGKAQGVAEQKAKLTSTTLTTNGTVTREDGWNEVTVDVDTTTPYNEGVAAGIAEQKAKLTSLNVTSNGTYNKEDGYNAVTVDVQPELEAKTVSYASNGEYTITPTTGKYGISEATVTVDVPSDVNNQDKTVSPTTSSQSVTADSGYSGLGTVTVEAVTSSIDANIAAGNIKSGVTILGVTGTVTEGITPTGNINITNTNSTDVTNYATAQVVDANLTAGNIKSGTTILGVQGSYDPQPDLETKSVTYTANDTYTITPTAGKDGMSSVEVTVNVTGSNCPDWSSIGWDCNDVENSSLAADVAYTAQKKAAFEAGTISNFSNDTNLKWLPKVTLPSDCESLFSGCSSVIGCPISFAGKPTSVSNMFKNSSIPIQPQIDLSEATSANFLFGSDGYYTQKFTTANVNLPIATSTNNMFDAGRTQGYLTSATVIAPSSLSASHLFSGQKNLTNVTLTFNSLKNCDYMFINCSKLETIPSFNTSSVTSAADMFTNCTSLTTIPQLNFSSVTGIGNFIGGCTKLKTLGGFLNLGESFTTTNSHTLDLSASTVLTKESIMNVINNLAAVITSVTNATLKLSAASYALLTEEDIAIATAKNWSVTSA